MNARKTFLAGTVALVVIGAAACSDADQTSAPSSGAATVATAVATAATAQEAPASPIATAATGAPSAPTAAPAKLNLNTATREQFLTVPGVGDRMVREFEEYRPYTSVAQFRREIGKYVSQDVVTAYEQYVFVPVTPNEADAETLRQLPGVDAAIAAQLIAGRPYANVDAFVTRLGQLTTPAQATAARSYLA